PSPCGSECAKNIRFPAKRSHQPTWPTDPSVRRGQVVDAFAERFFRGLAPFSGIFGLLAVEPGEALRIEAVAIAFDHAGSGFDHAAETAAQVSLAAAHALGAEFEVHFDDLGDKRQVLCFG